MLAEGDPAPDFELPGVDDGEVGTYRLSDYTEAGQWVLLTFYAFDFNPVCTTGMCSLRDTEFLQFEDGLSVLGVSGDGVYSHRRFAAEHSINYPLLSDTDKEVGTAYGVVTDEYEGMRRVHGRAVFLIDDGGTVRLAQGVDAETPEEIDLDPLVTAIRDIRG